MLGQARWVGIRWGFYWGCSLGLVDFFAHFPFSAAAAIADVAADVAPAAAGTEWYFSRFETGTISEIYAANYISELDNKALLLEAF